MGARLGAKRWAAVSAAVLTTTAAALAGMPSPTLTDVGRLRLHSIGFFIAVFFALSKLFQWLWNWLRRDFPRLPSLSFRRALGMVFLWGMLLELVLTMVSGARELLTPGAWEKVGVTYQTRSSAPGVSVGELTPTARAARLARLGDALKAMSTLPSSPRTSGLPDDYWIAPGGSRYVYLGEAADKTGIIAYEPPGLGDPRLTLERDFSIHHVAAAQLDDRILRAYQKAPQP